MLKPYEYIYNLVQTFMKDQVSYALGLSIGNNFKASGIKSVEGADFLEGLQDALSENKPQLTYAQAQELLHRFFEKLQGEEAEINRKAGDEYRKILQNKAGVTTLENGIQYEVLRTGTGAKPTAKDTVRVHYHGTLINGTVFDSSVERGEPAEFPLQGVISGWTYILQQMPVGSKWRVVLPPQMAYGERGAGSSIRPNMTLIFEIDLLDIVHK